MKRYDTMGFESEHGVWVRWADHDAEVARLNAENLRIHSIIHNAMWATGSDDDPIAVILRNAIPRGMGYLLDETGKTKLIRGPGDGVLTK